MWDHFNLADLHRYILDSHGVSLIEPPIDRRVGRDTIAFYAEDVPNSETSSPHTTLKLFGALVTSVILFFQKG